MEIEIRYGNGEVKIAVKKNCREIVDDLDCDCECLVATMRLNSLGIV